MTQSRRRGNGCSKTIWLSPDLCPPQHLPPPPHILEFNVDNARPSTDAETQPAPTLDILMYPHLLDAILSHADRPTLIALRTTSKHLHTLVDQHLYTHVLWSSHTFFDPSTPINASDPYSARGPRLPGLRWAETCPSATDAPDPRAAHAACTSRLAHVRVFDYISSGMSFLTDPSDHLARHMTRLALFRTQVLPGGETSGSATRFPSLQAKSMVLFATLDSQTINLNPYRYPEHCCVSPPGTVEHLTVNIKYDARHPLLPYAHIYAPQPHRTLRELVLIFTPGKKPAHAPWPFSLNPEGMPPQSIPVAHGRLAAVHTQLGVVQGMLLISTSHPDARISVVGLEEMPASPLLCWPDEPDELFAFLGKRMRELGEKGRVGFYTRGEYKAKVGEERYALECFPPGQWGKWTTGEGEGEW